jgi:hypothetical protein
VPDVDLHEGRIRGTGALGLRKHGLSFVASQPGDADAGASSAICQGAGPANTGSRADEENTTPAQIGDGRQVSRFDLAHLKLLQDMAAAT